LSSANSAIEVWMDVGWSAVYMLYRIGDEMAPWGIPAMIGDKLENSELNLMTDWRVFRYDLKNKKLEGGRSFLTWLGVR